MQARITPGKLNGKIDAVSSKSYLHRMILCAALSESDTVIYLNCRSKDVDATIRCAEAMGAKVEVRDGKVVVHPVKHALGAPIVGAEDDPARMLAAQEAKVSKASKASDGCVSTPPLLDCGESGSTARFVLPMTVAVCGGGTLVGAGRLPERPFGAICTVMEENGCSFSSYSLPMTVTGPLKSGVYRIPANISSQYISALMMSLPLVDGDSEIVFTTEVESEGYLDITESVMNDFGMVLVKTKNGYKIKGNRRYRSPGEITAEGDWSNGAFWVAANALGCGLEIGNLKEGSLQRDCRIVDVARKLFLGETQQELESVGKAAGGSALAVQSETEAMAAEVAAGNVNEEITVDGADIPDIIPISAIMACGRVGRTRFTNCHRLRLKESDRLMSVASIICTLGGSAIVEKDDLIVDGCGKLVGGEVDSFVDHRIVMSAAIAATICTGEVVINNAQDVAKSYPNFFEDYCDLGGKVEIR
ncbi:MAG: hypothetical protein IJZ85_02470 [Lachnospiraceae bacterium]|nr:hypothetical protein [Lachnospiraceae bacterium]